MSQNTGNFDNNTDPTYGSYRDVTGTNASINMASTLFTQNSSLFRPIPPASSSHSPSIQPTVFDASALVDGPPGHAAISICPREWWQERQPERTPLREEEQWPNRLFSSSPPLQSVPDFAAGSAPQLYQAPNQIDLINLQDSFQLPPPMTVQHPHASGVLTPINQKLYQATCGANSIVQAQIFDEFVRLQTLPTGERQDLAVQDDPNSAFWKCVLPGCTQKPQRQWDLAAHYLKHMNGIQKPWACIDPCGKLYARNGDLRRHQRTCRLLQPKSDYPIPIPSADARPNSPPFLPIGSSQQENCSQQTIPTSSSSTYSPAHFVAQSQTRISGTSSNAYAHYMPHQSEWPAPQNVHPYYPGPPRVPVPPHARNAGHTRTDSNSSAYSNGSLKRDENVKERVPIEVRPTVDMADLEVLEKGPGGSIRGRGDSRYSPRTNLTHKYSTSSIRTTALALGFLFVVVSSLFAWQLYRTLSP